MPSITANIFGKHKCYITLHPWKQFLNNLQFMELLNFTQKAKEESFLQDEGGGRQGALIIQGLLTSARNL